MNHKKSPREFQSILIANRGEIACRIMRTAKSMGLRCIAVYSDADRDAPHVRLADSAEYLGPSPVADSYLNMELILKAAKSSGAEAIHPGYGFLSENAMFAEECAAAGIVFIGPSAHAINVMGDKAKAKRQMIDAGVPCVPGYQGEDQTDEILLAQANEIGFPIMVKAAAGGGGRGMRLVESGQSLATALKDARSEALNAFGSGALILERAIIEPRHIEIQILADTQGNTIHLGERDCSVQRRHQKVLEEAPSPAVTPELREAMGAAAVKAAQAVSYVGAGTVEFLLDQGGAFYFLEMNTRLQVEHPVTELISNLDLVEKQISTAQGFALGLAQDDVRLKGHAIEARLYAEDVGEGFLPAAGPVDYWRAAPDIRTDAGIESGNVVSSYYDPMLAKIIAYGATREEARRKLITGLKQTAIFGLTTNKAFLIDALEKERFVNGEASTGFIGQSFPDAALEHKQFSWQPASCAAILFFLLAQKSSLQNAVSMSPLLLNWTSATPIVVPYELQVGDTVQSISLTAIGAAEYRVTVGDKTTDISVIGFSANDATLSIDGQRVTVIFNNPNTTKLLSRLQLSIEGIDYDVCNLNETFASVSTSDSEGSILVPMHGLLLDIFVTTGDKVTKGDRLAILEAMKMQHELTAPVDGTVAVIHSAKGDQVVAKSMLIEIDASV